MRSLPNLSELVLRNKVLRAVIFILFALMMGTGSRASSISGGLKNDPHFPGPTSGHAIPISLRGIGTIYMTAQEWSAISPYWNAFYVFGGLFVACGIGTVLVKAFKYGRRSDN